MATSISRDEEKERAIASWRNKTEASKKGEILREIQKLKVQIAAMEREKCTHLYSKRSDFREDFSQLEDMDSKAVNDRKAEQIRLKQQLQKMSHMVKRFHIELREVKATPEYIERLKVIMEDIEGTINAFKEQQRKNLPERRSLTRYEEILLEERTTLLEIQALEKKFDSWSQINTDTSLTRRPAGSIKPLASARDITKDLPPEVAAFEKFVEQNGGVRGGWDEYDHQTFLKFRQRYNGKPVFLQHLLPGLPSRTEEEIHSHEDWYQEYLFLNETKKDAIKKWRDRKEEEKEELLAKASEIDDKEEQEEERKVRLQAKIEEERLHRRAGLNAYKVQKELDRAHKEEQKLREALDKQRKQKDWKQKQEDMKASVQQHKRQKEEDESYLQQQRQMEEQEEKERKRQLSARELARFRYRDNNAMQHKKAKDKRKELEEKEKQERLERIKSQVEIEVERDPNRLLQPTAGWKNRARDKSSSGGQLLHMPHRAVPAWRQGP